MKKLTILSAIIFSGILLSASQSFAVADTSDTTGSSRSVTYDCSVKHPVEIITTTDGSGKSTTTERFLVELEVLEICKPTPGDLPLDETTAVDPVPDLPASETSEITAPAAAPSDPVTEIPAELAYTGLNWTAFTLGVLSLAGGFGLLRLNRKLG